MDGHTMITAIESIDFTRDFTEDEICEAWDSSYNELLESVLKNTRQVAAPR